MSDGKTWIEEILPLDRPEYAKQPEVLLTHLMWGSEGSSLNEISLTKSSDLAWLVPYLIRESKRTKRITKTGPIAKATNTDDLVFNQVDGSRLVSATLDSVEAPKSRGITSRVYVPIHPDVAALQTLRGMVNKEQPANIARIIENVGWLGGSDGIGHVAQLLLQTMGAKQLNAREGFTGLVEALFIKIAEYTWEELIRETGASGVPAKWPRVEPVDVIDTSFGCSSLAAHGYQCTPFSWFWDKWSTLCNPANRWFNVLPTRRFTDWATCLLRTSLSFAYLWEAEFFVRIYACLLEEKHNRENPSNNQTVSITSFQSMLENGAILATIESTQVPATQKHALNALESLLKHGYLARSRFIDHLKKNPFNVQAGARGIETIIKDWLSSCPQQDIEELSSPLQVGKDTANNTREFVRYLLMPRSSDDDSQDQADFYYLARTNSRHYWFQPGPEWLVVVTSLLAGSPGGTCTLGMLLDDLRRLGLRVERRILVSMLEEAGLTADSPDADNALVIQAGF